MRASLDISFNLLSRMRQADLPGKPLSPSTCSCYHVDFVRLHAVESRNCHQQKQDPACKLLRHRTSQCTITAVWRTGGASNQRRMCFRGADVLRDSVPFRYPIYDMTVSIYVHTFTCSWASFPRFPLPRSAPRRHRICCEGHLPSLLQERCPEKACLPWIWR